MAKRAGSTPTAPTSEPSRLGEIFGVFFILAAVLITLALISYNASDPSFNTVSPYKPSNFVGRVGAFLAEALLVIVGYSAYLIPILLVLAAGFQFTDRKLTVKISQLLGFLFLTATVSGFVRLVVPSGVNVESGGIIGMILGDFLRNLFGAVGAYFLIGSLFLLALLVTLDIRFISLGPWMARLIGQTGARIGHQLDRAAGRAQKLSEDPVITTQPIAPPKIEPKIAIQDEPNPKSFPMDEPAFTESFPISPEPPKPVEKEIQLSKVKVRAPVEKPEPSRQIEFVGFTGNYEYPDIECLAEHEQENVVPSREQLLEQSLILEEKLKSFKIDGRVLEVHPGPVITMFEFEPAPGVKVSQIANREDDLAMALRAESIRIVAPIPGKGAVGIEIPNLKRQIVSLKELIASEDFQKSKGKLPVVFGKDISGRVRPADLATMPHLLVAGTTGAGKSVFVNTIICSLLYRCSPDYLRMLMVDPKMLELSDYADIPHLLHPVVTDPRKAAVILRWAVGEMEDRYRKMAEMGVRNIDNYNHKVEKILAGKSPRPAHTIFDEKDESGKEPEELEKLPYILIIIDELSDLMIVAAKEVEESITRLAQMARAAGIHLLMATQRPSVDVITGVIKANFPARLSFKVSSKIDSRTILDTQGAENLLGRGDMLFLPPTTSKIERIHGAFVTEEEVQAVVNSIKSSGGPQYNTILVKAGEHSDDPGAMNGLNGNGLEEEDEELVERAWEIIRNERKASISYIQRRMKIGYNKAARIIEILEIRGFISPSDGTSRPREILMPGDENGDDS